MRPLLGVVIVGRPTGVMDADWLLALLVPTAFVAVTVNV